MTTPVAMVTWGVNGRDMATDVGPWFLIDRAIVYPWSYVNDKTYRDGADYHVRSLVDLVTRGTCLTGRHYYRYGIWSANVGHLPKQEITLARILKEQGYTTGHFGKWHLGTLSKTHSSKGVARNPAENYAPPWERDYDRSFVVESSVSTWDPGSDKNPFYDDGVAMAGSDESLLGGAARVVVDRAIPFMAQAVKDNTPFLAVVWFNAPHESIKAGPDYRGWHRDRRPASGRCFQSLPNSSGECANGRPA